MDTSTKQSAAPHTAKPVQPRNHHRFYFPRTKNTPDEPICSGGLAGKTFFRKTNPFPPWRTRMYTTHEKLGLT